MFRGRLQSKLKSFTKSTQILKHNVDKQCSGAYEFSENSLKHFENSRLFRKFKECLSRSSVTRSAEELSTVQNKEHNNSPFSLTEGGIRNKDVRFFRKICSDIHSQLLKNKLLLSTATVGVAESSLVQKEDASVVSASTVKSSHPITEPIPEPPPIPVEAPPLDVGNEVLNQLNALGESTFASLGLGGKTPVGWVQSCFEYLHVTLGIPWWEAIVLGTLVIRFCLFPLVILAQRNAAKMNNCLPQMQAIQLKMTEARQTGNQLDAARYSQELIFFMREKGINPLKNMLVPLAQMPVFISFFMGLREMANVPVESLKTGGILWFTDLTVPDQYFMMPIMTSFTLWLTIELGTDTARISSQNLQTMKYVLRALPVVVLPFTVNFPGAILCYWVSSNFISLLQVGFLRIPAVREFFKIEQLVAYKPEHLPMKPKGFTEGLKDSWTNMKITSELEERRRLDEMQFQRAGKGPIVKTYNFDPTKVNPNAMSAKKR